MEETAEPVDETRASFEDEVFEKGSMASPDRRTCEEGTCHSIFCLKCNSCEDGRCHHFECAFRKKRQSTPKGNEEQTSVKEEHLAAKKPVSRLPILPPLKKRVNEKPTVGKGTLYMRVWLLP